MSIVVDQRWKGTFGIGRFSAEVCPRLKRTRALKTRLPILHPLDSIAVAARLYFEKPRVYFSPGFNPPIACPCRLVFTIHDLIHLRCPTHSRDHKTLLQRAYYDWLVRPAARRAFRILTVSEFSKREICEWAAVPPERVVVVGNGVGSEFCPSPGRASSGKPYIFYVGNNKPHKNVPGLIRAFRLVDANPELELHLSGSSTPALDVLIRELDLEGRVRHVGIVPEQDLPDRYRGAVALVLPSFYEGFGLPALEAMACGTPVVASNASSLPEVVADAAILVDPHDVCSMAAGIQQVVSDSGLRSQLSQRGLIRAQRFNWDRTAGLVSNVLEAALQESES